MLNKIFVFNDEMYLIGDLSKVYLKNEVNSSQLRRETSTGDISLKKMKEEVKGIFTNIFL